MNLKEFLDKRLIPLKLELGVPLNEDIPIEILVRYRSRLKAPKTVEGPEIFGYRENTIRKYWAWRPKPGFSLKRHFLLKLKKSCLL